MTLEVITRDAFAREVGLVSEEGEISERGLAELLRSPLARWGLSARIAVLHYARDQVDAAGVWDQASPLVAEILDRLVGLGECEEVRVGHERYIAPAQPRWISTGRETGTLLSVGPIPDGVAELPPFSVGHDLVRRIHVRSDDDLAALRLAGVRQTSLEEWLQPHGYTRHAERRKGRVFRSDELSLSKFWDLLVAALADDGLPLGSEAQVRALTGKPGAFFGRYDSERCEGRWSEVALDGVWCAYRPGYGNSHWHPIILAVEGDQRRALDLFDADEWRWALLARGRWSGVDERVEWLDGQAKLSFPAPNQLVAAMDLLGPRRAPWSWAVGLGAPDPWRPLN